MLHNDFLIFFFDEGIPLMNYTKLTKYTAKEKKNPPKKNCFIRDIYKDDND